MQAGFGFEDEVRGEVRKDTYRRHLQVDRIHVKSYISWVLCFQISFCRTICSILPQDLTKIWFGNLKMRKLGRKPSSKVSYSITIVKANPTVRLVYIVERWIACAGGTVKHTALNNCLSSIQCDLQSCSVSITHFFRWGSHSGHEKEEKSRDYQITFYVTEYHLLKHVEISKISIVTYNISWSVYLPNFQNLDLK